MDDRKFQALSSLTLKRFKVGCNHLLCKRPPCVWDSLAEESLSNTIKCPGILRFNFVPRRYLDAVKREELNVCLIN